MQDKLNAILAELNSLKKQVIELENKIDWIKDDCLSSDYALDAIMQIKEALEFSDLDDIQKYTNENIIILHTNCFRTAALAKAYNAPARWNMHDLPDKELTPELLLNGINRSNQGTYILLKSNVFSISNKFESIILNAILEKKVFFIICTNNLEKIPPSIRNQMRVIQ